MSVEDEEDPLAMSERDLHDAEHGFAADNGGLPQAGPVQPQSTNPKTLTPRPVIVEASQSNVDSRDDEVLEADEGLLQRDQSNSSHNATNIHRRTVRKLDYILLPFLALLFLLNSLDKSNVGNAETAGFTHDVGLSQRDLNTSMAYFFFVFVLLQPFGAALGRAIGMARYVPTCMTLWGLSTIGHIFVRKKWQLIALRVTIAALESGFYPTTVSYLSMFYTKYEFGWRLGLFYGMSAVSGALGGIISWGIFSHWTTNDQQTASGEHQLREDAAGALKPWQILFLVEGCMTMLVASIGFVWLPHSPGTAWFLNRQERQCAEKRVTEPDVDDVTENKVDDTTRETPSLSFDEERPADVAGTSREHDGDDSESHHGLLPRSKSASPSRLASFLNHTDRGLTRHDVTSAVFNYKIWYLLVVNILSAIPATAFGVLLPLVVKQMSPALNISPATSNLLSAPPFAFGAISLFAFTAWSDRIRRRLVPIECGLALLLIGLVVNILAAEDNYWLRYTGICILLSGSYIASPLTVAWLANNTPEPGKRAILLGINGWGNLAGVFLAALFTPDERAHGYIRSFSILLGCVLVAFGGFAVFYFLLVWENRKRAAITSSWSARDREREEIYGDVKIPLSAFGRLFDRWRITAFFRRLSLREARMGDEKLTYRYSL